MNKQQRKRIVAIIEIFDSAMSDIEELKDEEEEKYDNLPESIQCSEKGETMQAAAEALENASSSIQEALDSLEEACN